MKRKIGTIIDEELLRRAKVAAAAQGTPLSHILEVALRDYLDRRGRPRHGGVVATTWGIMPADATLVKAILEEEGVFDA